MSEDAGSTLYDGGSWPVRRELSEVHTSWARHAAAPGTWWTGEQRVAFVQAVWDAIDDPGTRPPWDPPAPPDGWSLPVAAHDLAFRLARHAGTTTRSWYETTLAGLGTEGPAFVELVALAASGCAVAAFGPLLGLERPSLPAPGAGEPSRQHPPLVDATMSWVPVTPPADVRAGVVQAFSSVPAEETMLWYLADAQYIPLPDMVHLDWRRPGSPLHRRQLELVAARLSMVRECFY